MKLFVARDRSGALYLYTSKPHKGANVWGADTGIVDFLDTDMLSEVRWEDEEPTEVELVIKKQDV